MKANERALVYIFSLVMGSYVFVWACYGVKYAAYYSMSPPPLQLKQAVSPI